MPIVSSNAELERWLDSASSSWSRLGDADYKRIASNWKRAFWHVIEIGGQSSTGTEALDQLATLLPATVFVFNGFKVPVLANAGGRGTGIHAYDVQSLSHIDRSLANSEELILVDAEMSYSCIFTHEAGALAHEHLYEIPDGL